MRGTKLPEPCCAAVGVLTSDGQAMQRCAAISAFLCDWPAGGARTCDAALCGAHAREVGRNKHYCPSHHQEHLDTQAQPGLFTSLV